MNASLLNGVVGGGFCQNREGHVPPTPLFPTLLSEEIILENPFDLSTIVLRLNGQLEVQ